MPEKLKVPASNADERASKRRLRSIKRETTPLNPGHGTRGNVSQRETTKRENVIPPSRG